MGRHFSLAGTKTISNQLGTQLGTFHCEWWCTERSTLEIPTEWAEGCDEWCRPLRSPNILGFMNFLAGCVWLSWSEMGEAGRKAEWRLLLYTIVNRGILSKGTEHLHRQDPSLDFPPVSRQSSGMKRDCSSPAKKKKGRSTWWLIMNNLACCLLSIERQC